jgi:hypothetical protein
LFGAGAAGAGENGGEAGAEARQTLPEQDLTLLPFREGVSDRPDQCVEEQGDTVGRSGEGRGGHEHNKNMLAAEWQALCWRCGSRSSHRAVDKARLSVGL